MLRRVLVASPLSALLALFAGCEDGSAPKTADAGARGDGGSGGGSDGTVTSVDGGSDGAPTSGPGEPLPGGDCSTILCAAGTKCVYVGTGALCGAPCTTKDATCGSGLTCKCGGSCPMCKDCVLVCAP